MHRQRSREGGTHHDVTAVQRRAEPGKHTLTEALVQRMDGAGASGDQGAVHAAAARGTATAAGQLPFADVIQRAFGRHDISGIRAHVGSDAGASAQAMGARAYATGDHVVFDGAPDLHTAAHEAAHVVQQRGGVHLKGGVGEVGDRHEQHADAVADRVVRGESAEALLDEHAGSGGGAAAVQHKPSDFAQRFGRHPQFNLTMLQQLQRPAWNAYVLNVKPYFSVDDDDGARQTSVLYTVMARERALREDAAAESGKPKPDNFKAFSPAQLDLARHIATQIDLEKVDVFGTGRLDTSGMIASYRVRDGQIKTGGVDYVDNTDPTLHDGNKLFPAPPTIADVQQGGLGDCYLLAAVTSVVHTNPGHFLHHMKDNLDGTVTVRLYSAANTPMHVTIDKKSVGNQFAQNVLWVKMIEKAYVASGLKTNLVGGMEDRAFKDIEGGSADQALMHLTGKPAGTFRLGQERARFQLQAPTQMDQAVSGIKQQLGVIGAQQHTLEQTIKQKREKDSKADVSAEQTEVQKLGEEFARLSKQWVDLTGPSQELNTLLSRVYVSRATLEQFLKLHSDNELLGRVVEQAGLGPETLPGELGSGQYSRDDFAAFDRIRHAVDGGKPITAGTKNSIQDPDNPAELEKGVAGEAKVAGLAAKHEYAVLDYKPGRGQYRPGMQLMVQLRNPWGNYGRKYEMVKDKLKGVADPGGDGKFWIDVADLVAYFENLTIGG